MEKRIIAVDFDGTLCKDDYPDIGAPNTPIIALVKAFKDSGDIIILWTCRKGARLDAAIAWCKEQGITFDYINENAPERVGTYGGDSRKISADVYIDDKAATPVLLGYNAGIVKGIWRIVAELFEQLALLDPYPATAVLKEKARIVGERKEGAGDV